MAGIPRKTQKIFGGSLTPTGNLGVPGSTADGATTWSSDLATLQANARYLQGFAQVCVGQSSPVMEEFNSLLYILTTQIGYLLERGLPEYDPLTTYNLDDQCRVGSAEYISLVDNNTGNAVTDTAKWIKKIDYYTKNMKGIAKAWVTFTDNGTTASVVASHNVSSVTRSAQGQYLISFPAGVFANSDYGWTSGMTQQDTVSSTESMTRFIGDTKTTTSFLIRCAGAEQSNMARAPEATVVFYQ